MTFDVDNVDAAIEMAKRYGVAPIDEPSVIDKGPNSGRRVVYLIAWDGMTIEFIEVK